MSDYFEIIEESNHQLISLIDKINITSSQWFPIYAFSKIHPDIHSKNILKEQQRNKLEAHIEKQRGFIETAHKDIESILHDDQVTRSNKANAIVWSLWNNNLKFEDVKQFLIGMSDKKSTDYRRLLCTFDYKKYST